MPVKSSSSSVLRWPDAAAVVASFQTWAARQLARPGWRRWAVLDHTRAGTGGWAATWT